MHRILLTLLLPTLAAGMPPDWNSPSVPETWFSPGRHHCLPMPSSFACASIGYKEIGVPNPLNLETFSEIETVIEQFKPLFRFKCHESIKILVCMTVAPMCVQDSELLLPCRSMCEDVKPPCAAIMAEYGHPWPHFLNCSRFQNSNTCVKFGTPQRHACRSCPAAIDYFGIIGRYCVSKAVVLARVRSVSTLENSTLLSISKVRVFKSQSMKRRQLKGLSSIRLDGTACSRCQELQSLPAEGANILLMADIDDSTDMSDLVVTFMKRKTGEKNFRQAILTMRVMSRGREADFCRMKHLYSPEAVYADALRLHRSDRQKKRRRNRKGKRNRKGRRNRKERRNRRNRKGRKGRKGRRGRRGRRRDRQNRRGRQGGGDRQESEESASATARIVT